MALSATERQLAHRSGVTTPTALKREFGFDNAVDPGESSILTTRLPIATALLLTEDVAYWVYLGRTTRDLTVNKVFLRTTTAGAGAQVAEIAIASSPTAPNRLGQTLTTLAVNGTLDDLTAAAGVKGNTVALGLVVPTSTYLWAGFRVNMASTEPTVTSVNLDLANGNILTTATAGILAVGTAYVGALTADTVATTGLAPYLFAQVAY